MEEDKLTTPGEATIDAADLEKAKAEFMEAMISLNKTRISYAKTTAHTMILTGIVETLRTLNPNTPPLPLEVKLALEEQEEQAEHKSSEDALKYALSNLSGVTNFINIFIDELQEGTTIKTALSYLYGINEAPTREKADAFLETLTPSKVKSLLPLHELTPQEKAALTYTKEERAARRNGSAEEAQAATTARRNRAKAFLASLNTMEAITLLIKGTSGARYNTFVPAPAALSEDYTRISTTQFSRVIHDVVNLADFNEAAKRINRKTKKKAAQAGTMKQGALNAIQVNERGGGLKFAVSAGIELDKIAENGQKELDYIIGQIYRRDYDTERELMKAGVITITDNDLAKDKVCGTDNKAVNRRNFLDFLTFLSESKGVVLTVTNKKNKKGEAEAIIDKLDIVPLFKRITTKRGGVYELVPNEQFNWPDALRYYAPMPSSAFLLSSRAYKTLIAILQKARISAADRPNPAEINIPLTETSDLLQLPLNTNETKKLIKTPIRNIVDEINQTVKDICLTLEADEDAAKAQYLTGSIKATFGGDILLSFEKIKDDKKKEISKQIRKHNRAINAQKQREANAEAKAKAAKK